MSKILLIDDDEALCELLAEYLAGEGFVVQAVHDGVQGEAQAIAGEWDAIILDVMLPGMNGFDVLKRVKPKTTTPVLMLTARGEDTDTVLGLELGADDYICKPYSPREVVARVKAVLRRTDGRQGLRAAGLCLAEETLGATLNGQELSLTAVEFKLLQHLAAHPGRIFSRDQLMERIYADQRIVCDRTIDSHIKKLRKKIQTIAPETDLIRSVYGVGYKFEPSD